MTVTLQLAYAIAWAGAGRSSVSPVLVQSISATVTAVFFVSLMWLTRRMPPATEVRRQAARLLPFRARDGRPRSRAIPTILALIGVGLWAPGTARAQSPASTASPSPTAAPAPAKPDPFAFNLLRVQIFPIDKL